MSQFWFANFGYAYVQHPTRLSIIASPRDLRPGHSVQPGEPGGTGTLPSATPARAGPGGPGGPGLKTINTQVKLCAPQSLDFWFIYYLKKRERSETFTLQH